jgi:hypothetical protein
MMLPAGVVDETGRANGLRIQRGHGEPPADNGPETWRNSGALGAGPNVPVNAKEVCRVVLLLDRGQAVVIAPEGGPDRLC